MWVAVFTELAAIPADVVKRLSVKSGVPFFRSIEWFDCLVCHGLERNQSPRVYVALDSADPQCALYCLHDATRNHLYSLTNFYSTEYGPVLTGPRGDEGLWSIVTHLATERPRWRTIDLRLMDDIDREMLQEKLSAAGFSTHVYHQYSNWYLDAGGRSFADYFAARKSQLRNTIERKNRKAEREHKLRLAAYPADRIPLDDVIHDFEAVYARSWKEPEPFPDFIPMLIRTCDSLQLARVGLAWLDGEPAAAQFWVCDRDTTTIYKLAYDERFADQSVGSILSKRMFQHALDTDRVSRIDYGVGDEAYKRDWMESTRQRKGLLACNRLTLSGLLTHLRETAARVARRGNHRHNENPRSVT